MRMMQIETRAPVQTIASSSTYGTLVEAYLMSPLFFDTVQTKAQMMYCFALEWSHPPGQVVELEGQLEARHMLAEHRAAAYIIDGGVAGEHFRRMCCASLICHCKFWHTFMYVQV